MARAGVGQKRRRLSLRFRFYQRFLDSDAGRAVADGTTNAEPIFKMNDQTRLGRGTVKINIRTLIIVHLSVIICADITTTDTGNRGLNDVVVIV